MADFNITALIGADVKNFKDGMSEAKGALADLKKVAGQTMAQVGDALVKGGNGGEGSVKNLQEYHALIKSIAYIKKNN